MDQRQRTMSYCYKYHNDYAGCGCGCGCTPCYSCEPKVTCVECLKVCKNATVKGNLVVEGDKIQGKTLCLGGGAVQIRTGTGSPEGTVAAPLGSLYLNQAGGAMTLWVKQSGAAGNTGWVAK